MAQLTTSLVKTAYFSGTVYIVIPRKYNPGSVICPFLHHIVVSSYRGHFHIFLCYHSFFFMETDNDLPNYLKKIERTLFLHLPQSSWKYPAYNIIKISPYYIFLTIQIYDKQCT